MKLNLEGGEKRTKVAKVEAPFYSLESRKERLDLL